MTPGRPSHRQRPTSICPDTDKLPARLPSRGLKASPLSCLGSCFVRVSQGPGWSESSTPQVGAGEDPPSACGRGRCPSPPATPGSTLALEQLRSRPVWTSRPPIPAQPYPQPLKEPSRPPWACCRPWASPPSGGWMGERPRGALWGWCPGACQPCVCLSLALAGLSLTLGEGVQPGEGPGDVLRAGGPSLWGSNCTTCPQLTGR